MIRIRNLKKRYGNRLVLDVPEYSLAAGAIHVLAGHNGSGKTTLMRIINGLAEPTEGSVECAVAGRDMVFCAQKPYMFSTSVQRNVEYGLRARGLADAPERAMEMLKRLKIDHLANQQARDLSGGETQKVAIARALVLEPELLLLDEPLANLDEESRGLVEECVLEQQNSGTTIVIATHLLQHMYHITPDVTRMKNGRILASDTTNIFEGDVFHEGNHTMMQISHSLSIAVATEIRGTGRGVLPPEDVVLSTHPLESSMRNCYQGTIIEMKPNHEHVDVIVDIGVMLTARITPESVGEMQLQSGTDIYAAFKATAVTVY